MQEQSAQELLLPHSSCPRILLHSSSYNYQNFFNEVSQLIFYTVVLCFYFNFYNLVTSANILYYGMCVFVIMLEGVCVGGCYNALFGIQVIWSYFLVIVKQCFQLVFHKHWSDRFLLEENWTRIIYMNWGVFHQTWYVTETYECS